MSIFRKKVDSSGLPPNEREDNTVPAGRLPVAGWNWWKIGGITAGTVVGVGTLGFFGISLWVSQNLSPTIAKELTKSLERDVQLGRVENIGLNEISFGPSSVAANAQSASKATVQGITIRFDPLALIWQRTLKPDITIQSPQLYLEQDDRELLRKLSQKQKPGPLKTEIQGIHVRQAQGTVVSAGKKYRIDFQNLDINATFQHKDSIMQAINFDGKGQVVGAASQNGSRGSQLAIQGSTNLANQTTHADIQGQALSAATIGGLLQLPAVKFRSGIVDGNISLDLQPQQPLVVQGSVQVRQATIQIDQVPQLFQQTSGTVQLLPHAVQLQNVATLYGQVPGQIDGNIDFRTGYNLRAQTATVSIGQVTKTLAIQSPVPLAGQASASLSLTGQLDRPVLAGKVKSTGVTQVDRLRFNQVAGDFTVADGNCSFSNILAFPTVGGALSSNGTITLTQQPQLRFNFQGTRLPADLLAKIYGQQVPIALGVTSVSGQVFGGADQLTTDLKINAPQAAYPGSANLRISPQGTVQIQQARIRVAGQEIVGVGQVDRNRWQLNVQVPEMSSQKLVEIAAPANTDNGQVQTLPPFLQGMLSGQMLLSGATQGGNDRIQGQGRLQLKTAAGNFQATSLRLGQGQWQSNIQTSELRLAKIDPQLAGKLSGQFQVAGNLKIVKPETITATGRGAVVLGQGKITGQNLQLSQGKWQGEFSSDRLDLGRIGNPQLKGQLSGRFRLNGDIQKLTPTAIQGRGSGVWRLPTGQVVARNLMLERGQWQGEFSPEQLAISQFVPTARGLLSGKFNLAGNLQQMNLTSLRGNGSGQLQVAGGQLVANRLQFQDGNWQSDLALSALRLGGLASTLPAPWQTARLTGNFRAGGRLDRFSPQSLSLQGNGQLNLERGVVTARGLTVNDGQWQGLFGFQAIDLQQFPLNLPGNFRQAQFSGQFQLAGQLQEPSVQTAQGAGRLRLPVGQIVAHNLTVAGDRWQGQFQTTALPLNQLSLTIPPTLSRAKVTSAFSLGGSLKSFDPKQLNGSGTGQIDIASGQIKAQQWQIANGRWQGQITAQNLDLPSLVRLLPSNRFGQQLQAGKLNATGQVAGDFARFDPTAVNLNAQVSLHGLRVANLGLEPNLQGSIETIPGQSLNVRLAGQRDRVELSLGANNQLLAFLIQLDRALASGQVLNDELQVKAKNIPVDLVASFWPQIPQQYQLNGLAGGELSLNLKTGAIQGKDLVVDQPQIGAVTGDFLQSSNFQYADGVLEIKNGQFLRGKNQYLVAARIVTTSQQPEYQLTIQVPQGELADVRNLFQIFSIDDLLNPFGSRNYGRASDLQPQQAGNDLHTLQEQVERLSEVKRLIAQQAELRQNDPLPDFRKIQGDFKGVIVVSNAAKSGAYASFNVQGQNWNIDRYNLSQINIQGKWQNNILNLGALELLSTTAKIKVAGEFGFEQQDARIEIEKFPLERLSNIFNWPVEVAGDVNIQAQLGGSWFNPTISQGKAALVDGKFNQSDIPVINTNFSYANSRLTFDSKSTAANTPADANAPIVMSGSIPYQLPFALVGADNNEISLNLMLQNQGMKMLDVLTQQQAIWLGGNGQINLQAKGQLNNQKLTWNSADGKASIQDAAIKFSALSDNVIALNSQVIFDFDRVQVDRLAGKYSDGLVMAVGSIPINSLLKFNQPATCLGQPANIPPSQQPLAVSFDRVQVKIQDKYEGGLSGCVILGTGSIMQPLLGGEIKLANGKVILPGQTAIGERQSALGGSSETSPVQFQDLKVILGENVTLEQFGLLSLVANGELLLKGSLDQPQPTGTVNLSSGQFTLFTSRFRLTGNDNVAKFYGNTNAIVSLNLSTKVLETSRLPVTVGNERREQNDTFSTSLGQAQTVQIDASIKELPISNLQLDDAEFLRSKPPRGKDEILLLLSNGLGRVAAGEESVGTGLINWAGSALLGGIQTSISDLLGLSDFRLYPSFSQSRGSTTSALGLAGEVGYNLNDNVSASVFKILTSSELPQYSIRYQIDDRLLLRGSSNLSGDSRVLLEFEQRF